MCTREVGAGYKNSDDIVRTDNRRFLFFYLQWKALEVFPGACPVTDRLFHFSDVVFALKGSY